MHGKYTILLGNALSIQSNLWLVFRVLLKRTVLRSVVFVFRQWLW